jgi:hypothetical protein
VPGYEFDLNRYSRAIAVLGMPATKLSKGAERSIVKLLRSMRVEGAITRDFEYLPHSKFAAKDCPCDSTRDRMVAIHARSTRFG